METLLVGGKNYRLTKLSVLSWFHFLLCKSGPCPSIFGVADTTLCVSISKANRPVIMTLMLCASKSVWCLYQWWSNCAICAILLQSNYCALLRQSQYKLHLSSLFWLFTQQRALFAQNFLSLARNSSRAFWNSGKSPPLSLFLSLTHTRTESPGWSNQSVSGPPHFPLTSPIDGLTCCPF